MLTLETRQRMARTNNAIEKTMACMVNKPCNAQMMAILKHSLEMIFASFWPEERANTVEIQVRPQHGLVRVVLPDWFIDLEREYADYFAKRTAL